MEKSFIDIFTKKELEILKRSNGVDLSCLPWQIQACTDNVSMVFNKLVENKLISNNINYNLKNLKNVELKNILKNHGLKISGDKQALIERIYSNLDIDKLDLPKKYYLTDKGKEYVDRYYKALDEEEMRLYSNCFSLIEHNSLNECYKEIAKFYINQPIYQSMDWEKELKKGLSKKNKKHYSKLLESSAQTGTTICSILSDMMGKPIDTIVSAYNRIHCSSLDSEDIRSSLSKVQNLDELNNYKNTGIKKYIFLATLDNKTCEKCGSLDGQIFDINNASVGINFPPLHVGCRCTTIAYSKEVFTSQRRARNRITNKSEVIPFITYKDWNAES